MNTNTKSENHQPPNAAPPPPTTSPSPSPKPKSKPKPTPKPVSNPTMVLTKNIISSMISGEIFRYPRMICSPIVEVFYINNISSNKSNPFSYCIVIFDGVKRAPVFVDNSLNGFVTSGLIIKGSIIKLLDFRPFTSNHLKTITIMKMAVLKYNGGLPTSINNDTTANGKPQSCKNGTTGKTGNTIPSQTNCLPLESSSTGEPKMEQQATSSDSLEPNDDDNIFVDDPSSEAAQSILTTGAISKIATGQMVENLTVQVVHTFQSIEEKQFMFISDGLHMQIAMLSESLNHLILSGELKTGSVVQLLGYICPTPLNGMQMMVVSMEVKIFENEVIGKPKLYVEPASNLDDGKIEDLADPGSSFFMYQPHLLGNHQDIYLANVNNPTIRGDTMLLAPSTIRSVEVTALVEEVEMLQLEINRLHLERKSERENHEGEVLRLKLEMQNEQKKQGDQISQLQSEIVQQYSRTENQIKVLKMELEAVKKMAQNKEEKDVDTKIDDELGANFDKLDEELERIWL